MTANFDLAARKMQLSLTRDGIILLLGESECDSAIAIKSLYSDS